MMVLNHKQARECLVTPSKNPLASAAAQLKPAALHLFIDLGHISLQ